MADDESEDLLKGTLDMLILQALDHEPMHGWGIADRIEQSSRAVFRLQTGTVYPSLHRLTRRGWITAEWRTTENNRRARYYRLTASGRKRLESSRASWARTSLAIRRVLDALS
jgi:PadR family transcriptional regulator